jgi:hypothetical protein
MQTSTLRPGFLVSLKTTLRGNVSYISETTEAEHTTETGVQRARWETERTISDPAEFEAAKQARGKARTAITRVCSASAFGLLCPETSALDLDRAIADAREIAQAFNATARLTRIEINVLCGRIAADDVEAVRAINSEVRELLETMSSGLEALDVDRVREAATKAKAVSNMLTPLAQARVQLAIEAARQQARKITQAGEAAAIAIDRAALQRITEARLEFLDLDDFGSVSAPAEPSRALDLEPVA